MKTISDLINSRQGSGASAPAILATISWALAPEDTLRARHTIHGGATRLLSKTVIAVTLALALFCFHPAAHAQSSSALMPAESAAKARAILDQAIEALGGPLYLRLHDSDCMAKLAGFERSGQIGGLGDVHVLRQLPDKNRTEYDKLGTIVTIELPARAPTA